MLVHLINITELIIFIYLGSTTLYLLVFGVSGHFSYRLPVYTRMKKRKFAVLIPAYKEDNVIFDTASEALKQVYSIGTYDVIVIADSLKPSTIEKLSSIDVKTVIVSFEKSTKSKALNKAMEVIGDDYDVALILDADNIMAPGFIDKINESFNRGFKVVQGHRISKNMNTPFAILDSISEEINNHIFRKAHRNLGLSAALIGSGMAFEYQLFKKVMSTITAIGGFDKELEMTLLKNNIKIEYQPDAYVMDEKVQDSQVFVNQRRRWLSAQVIYFCKNIGPAFGNLITKGRFDYFDKALQMGQLPRILLLGIVGAVTAVYGIAHLLLSADSPLILNFTSWLTVLLALSTALFISVPGRFFTSSTLSALLSLPKGFFLMMISLFRIKGANEKFLHTTHNINTL